MVSIYMNQKSNQSKRCPVNWTYSIFIAIVGTILHFLYDRSGENQIVALFSAVDESVFEHLKIFFVPAFLYSIFMVGKKEDVNLWCQTKSILYGLMTIILIYYTYRGITQKNLDWLNVSIFYIAALVSGVVSSRCNRKAHDSELDVVAGVVLLLLWAFFIWCTYQLPLIFVQWLPGLFLES